MQLKILRILNLSKKGMFFILFIQNLLFSFFLVLLSFIISEISILLNYKYNLLAIIFNSLPFHIIPFNFNYVEYSLIGLFLILMNSLVGTLPMFFIKYNWNE